MLRLMAGRPVPAAHLVRARRPDTLFPGGLPLAPIIAPWNGRAGFLEGEAQDSRITTAD